MTEGPDDFKDILRGLDEDVARINVRLEIRRFRKPVTIIQGLSLQTDGLLELGRDMKRKLATGGSVKEGLIVLQGDHRERVREMLVQRGFDPTSIEVQ